METVNATLVDITHYSQNFPTSSNKRISRDNYHIQIKSELEENKILFIEGDEDAGKTFLLSDFASLNKNNTITVFFSPLNNIDYQIDYFLDNINSQMEFLLDPSKEISSVSSNTIHAFRNLLIQIRKRYKGGNKKLYIIIDGLETKFEKNTSLIKEILEIVPLGGEDFIKIIITGSQIKYLQYFDEELKKCRSKSLTVLGLNKSEIKDLLELNDDYILDKIIRITKGFPGRLHTIKRLLQEYTIDQIIENETYNAWVNLDCTAVDLNKNNVEVILSLVTFSQTGLDIKQISEIIEIDEIECNKIVSQITILEINEKLKFVSPSHKKFFLTKLRNNKNKTEELLIQYYTDSNTITSKYELFKFFSEKQQWGKLHDIANEDFILGLIENTGSLKNVNDSIEIICNASSTLKNYPTTFKYSIIGSIINELDSYTFWESEILARLALNDYTGAINLAESAILNADRLRLLSLIAKSQKENNKNVDEDLSNLIYNLYKYTDLSDIGNLIYDIVSNLIYALPNLAIEIIERFSAKDKSDNINDLIIAQLSYAAIHSNDEGAEEKTDAISKLNNPSTKKIHRAISFLVGKYSSDKVLSEVKKLNDSNERIKLLRLWIYNNRYKMNDDDREKIINFSLDEIINASTDITINFEILKELSSQLPYIKKFEVKDKLLKRFKILEPNVKNLGMSKDKFIYELHIFQVLHKLSPDKSIFLINNIIKDIESLDDLLIKIESYSQVYNKLFNVKNTDIQKKRNFIYHKLNELSNELISKSANHYNSFSNTLKTISLVDPLFALDIISKTNTLITREKLRILILESYLRNSLNKIDFSKLKTIYLSFENQDLQGYFTKILLERMNEADSLPKDIIQELLYFTNNIKNFKLHPTNKISYYNLFYKVISKNDYWKNSISNNIIKNIDFEFEKIDREWEKIDLGYQICFELADINKSFAKNKFNEAEKIKNNAWIDSESIARLYTTTISMSIKAFEGLLINKENIDKEYSVLEQIIGGLPSELEKILLWTQLSITAYINDKLKFAKKVYDKHILPIYPTLEVKGLKVEDALETLILIHIFNSSLAVEIIKKLPYFVRHECCNLIAQFYLNKKNPFNYYEGEILNKNLTLQDIYNTLSILDLTEIDNIVYGILNEIYKTDFHKSFTRIQIADIIEKLNNIIDRKIPDKKNIQHDGFKVISKLILELIQKTGNLKLIFDEVNKIQNISDQIFIKSNFLDYLPFERVNFVTKKEIFNSIIKDLDELPTNYEFVDRVSQISEVMIKIDRTEWKKVVDKAFLFSKDIKEGTDAYQFQRNMIDAIYRVDENLAKDLINSIDDENNEFKQKKVIKKYYQSLEISNKIKNNKTIEQKEKEDLRVMTNSIRKTLGSINSGKTTIKKISEVANLLFVGYQLPLLQALPVFDYYFSNCAKLQLTKNSINNTSKIHEKNFEEMIKATQLVQYLSRKRKVEVEKNRKIFIENAFNNNFVANPGSRDKALDYIRGWIKDEVEDFIVIADPYFQASDLEILKYIKETGEDIIIDILGSKEFKDLEIEQKMHDYWRKISDEIPPSTTVTFCTIPEDGNNTPFHDRYIISKNGGLRIGTSFGSLGVKKDSEISLIDSKEAANIYNNSLFGLITGRTRFSGNLRINFKSFSL